MNNLATKSDIFFATFILMSFIATDKWLSLVCFVMALLIGINIMRK